MKRTILMLTVCVCAFSINSHATIIFSDDFQDGTLDKWIIGGRQDGRESTAEVVIRHDSLMAHLFQDGLTEISIANRFAYQDNLHLSFDMETLTYSEASGTDSEWYAAGMCRVAFLDNQSNVLGFVKYISATSTHLIELEEPMPDRHHIQITDGALNHFSIDIEDLLSEITIDQSAITEIQLGYSAYTSGNMYNMSTHVWVDNVLITPEPASLLLLGLGALCLRKKK